MTNLMKLQGRNWKMDREGDLCVRDRQLTIKMQVFFVQSASKLPEIWSQTLWQADSSAAAETSASTAHLHAPR